MKYKFTDTDRLNFLLREIEIDDIGDDIRVPGVIVRAEAISDALTWGKADKNGCHPSLVSFGDDIRAVIDRAMIAHANEEYEFNDRYQLCPDPATACKG